MTVAAWDTFGVLFCGTYFWFYRNNYAIGHTSFSSLFVPMGVIRLSLLQIMLVGPQQQKCELARGPVSTTMGPTVLCTVVVGAHDTGTLTQFGAAAA